MRNIILSILSAVSVGCGPDVVEITTIEQPSELNRFIGVTTLDGIINISCPTCTSLQALSDVRTIKGSLIIRDNDHLTNLQGLEGVEEVWGVFIVRNAVLSDLSQLDGIDSMRVNPKIIVERNPSLIQLNGFGGITTLTSLEVSDNVALESIGAFADLKSIEGDLKVLANPSLDHCATIGLRDRLGIRNIGGDFPTSCECSEGMWESMPGNCN